MIEHYLDGRRVYTLSEAAELLNEKTATLRQRLHRANTEAAGYINPREPVYYPEDLGRGEAMKTKTRNEQAIALLCRSVEQYEAEFRRAVDLNATALGSVLALAQHGPDHGMTDAEIVEQVRRVHAAVERVDG